MMISIGLFRNQFHIPLSYDLFNELVRVANDSLHEIEFPTPPATPLNQDFEMKKESMRLESKNKLVLP